MKHWKTLILTLVIPVSSFGGIFFNQKPAHAWFEVCNRSGESVSLAFAYLDRSDNRHSYYNNGWVSEGWWNLNSGDCTQVYPHELWRRNRFYYVYAQGNKGRVWKGNKSFCTVQQRFKLGNAATNCSGPGRTWKNFVEINTGRSSDYTFNLTD